MKKVGIMGGTFDPIHYGHLVTAETARVEFALDEVVFVPSGRPPHKRGHAIGDGEHRCAMTQLAIASNPYFRLSRVELEREGFSFALDTVNYFLEQYDHDVDLRFITGADAIREILHWYKVEELMEKCRFLAASRPGYALDVEALLPEKWRDRVAVLPVPSLAISSSYIRQAVQNGKSVKYLLPEAVETYLHHHRLYRDGAQ